ncbi:hypothetical protein NPX13_g6571 [Xylaria arbuscula]|uniref:Uncharacterized protein n=1 Tax=Xylaria arbuscula TaxID=114810 RepID=A0A9W8TLA5_9PEZI|nr:hypothetical protein NPX13_g6571 [Xylaria arbuscula]
MDASINEELGFRRARKRLSDVLSLAPVSGIQTYLRSYTALVDVEDRDYVSPYGRKCAPLRNLRTAKMIEKRGVLEDGFVSVYRIENKVIYGPGCRLITFVSWFVTAVSWVVFGLLVLITFRLRPCTWIGKSNLLAFAVWSIYLRTLDAVSFVPATTRISLPETPDSVVFFGRRNSAFILEGSRRDIIRWTGLGLRYRTLPRNWRHFLKGLRILARIGTFLLLSFMFATIPNGTTDDQVVFIVYNVFGQLSTWLSLFLHTHRTLLQLRHVADIAAATRTHVYAVLLRRYKHDEWIDDVDILPRTPIWKEWRHRVAREPTDAKQLWEECARNR